MFKRFIVRILEAQAARLLKKNKPRIVAVTGSVGKTSTKLNIATVLSQKYRVLAHFGSYNTPIAVPLAIFDLHLPAKIKNPFAWLSVIWAAERKIRKPYPYDVLVLELGADHPGDVGYFASYITPDIAVVTAVSPEHMEHFGTMDAVAKEELSVTYFAKQTLINRDDIDISYSKFVPDGINISTYGISGVAEYRFTIQESSVVNGFSGEFVSPEFGQINAKLQLVGEHSIKGAVAAAAVAAKLGLDIAQITAGLQAIRPVQGRMNILRGLQKSILIDDTYNSSPLAAVAALQTLYIFPATQRIAILGSMNELGSFSAQAHKQVGDKCDPNLLDWVITIGQEAKTYLAPAALSKGCQVRSFDSPYDAGGFAHSVLQQGAVVLAKGSQNGVFAEEALKELLHSTQDETQLVRQTPDWLAIKRDQFEKIK